MWIAGGLALAVVVVAVLIAALSGGDSSGETAPAPAGSTPATAQAGGVTGATAVAKEFRGIPQNGNALGARAAPVTMMVFADMQCPFCAEFENGTLPALIDKYVRPGDLRIVFQPVAILGDDSVTGARWVSAAANQDKLFEYAALFYRNQGQENSGYVTDAFLRRLAKATPGLDVGRVASDAAGEASTGLLARAQAAATTARVDSTPTFLVGRKGDTLERLEVASLDVRAFVPKLDLLLSRG